MRLFENYLCLRYPQHMFMISITNQNSTEGDIMKMGQKLGEEVKEFILQWCPDKCLSRLSFVAHSLGGLIVRAALPYLQNYQDKMYTFISLGSPHLGYLHNSHGLIKFGLWLL
jgi:triacylglycerol esterase/lipase EstA (alpha/beta hydrolase family)